MSNEKKHPSVKHFKTKKAAEIYKYEDDTLKKIGKQFPAEKIFEGMKVKFIIKNVPKTAVQIGLKKGFYLNPTDVAMTEKDGKVIHSFTSDKKIAERLENSSDNKVHNFNSPAPVYQKWNEYLGVDAAEVNKVDAAVVAPQKNVILPTYIAALPLAGAIIGLGIGLRNAGKGKGNAMQTIGYVTSGLVIGLLPVFVYSAMEIKKMKANG